MTHEETLERDGIHLERRTLLWLPIAAAGGAVLGSAAGAAQEMGAAARAAAFAPLGWDEFGERWRALARELRGTPAENDESFAAQLAGMIARVPESALPKLAQPKSSGGGLHGGPSWFLAPCVTVEFRMDPGATLRLHNHPPLVVVTLGVEGEARYRHLELEGEAPPCTEIGGELLARETRAGLLLPGRTTALTRMRDGIHGFVAGPRGARIVDFTVGLTDDVETFSYIELSETPFDAERRIYEGRWTGKG